MRSCRVRARDGRNDDTETTTPRRRRERMKFHSIRAPSSRRPSSSRTRRPRAAVDANHAFDPIRPVASRCDAMRTSRLTTGARRARALGRAHRVHRRGRPREHRLRAHLPRDGLAKVARTTSAGPPPEPWGEGEGAGDRSIIRSSDIGKTPCTYGVFDHTPF